MRTITKVFIGIAAFVFCFLMIRLIIQREVEILFLIYLVIVTLIFIKSKSRENKILSIIKRLLMIVRYVFFGTCFFIGFTFFIIYLFAIRWIVPREVEIFFLLFLVIATFIFIQVKSIKNKKYSKQKRILMITLYLVISSLIISGYIGSIFFYYRKDIQRDFSNQTERDVIQRAEHLDPIDGILFPDDFDKVKLASQVTNKAINYYSELIDNLRMNPYHTGFFYRFAEFRYTAQADILEYDGEKWFGNGDVHNINFKDNETESMFQISGMTLWKIVLKINFDTYTAPLAALWFTLQTVVIFDMELHLIDINNSASASVA